MKTHAIEWSPIQGRDSRIVLNPGYSHSLPRKLHAVLSVAARALLALVAAAAVVVATAWLITLPEFAPYLQAAIWAGGFVFLALAVEISRASSSLLQTSARISRWLRVSPSKSFSIVAQTRSPPDSLMGSGRIRNPL